MCINISKIVFKTGIPEIQTILRQLPEIKKDILDNGVISPRRQKSHKGGCLKYMKHKTYAN